MSDVPSNLIPTRVTQLPEAPVASEDSLMMIIYQGNNYKIRVGDLLSVAGVPTSRQVIAGTGLAGGGALSSNVTLSVANGGIGPTQLSTTGVAAGSYGTSTTIPVFTVDSNGRITSATTIPVEISGYVPDTRQVIAGTGMSGGGQLTGNVTLNANLSNATPQFGFQAGSAGVSNNISRADHKHPAVDLSADDQVDNILGLSNGGTARSLVPNAGAIIWCGADGLYVGPAGVAGQVLVSNGQSQYLWIDQDTLDVDSAARLRGGAANQIVYQTGVGATGFLTAPTVTGTVLQWNGSAFVWAGPADISAANIYGGAANRIPYQTAANTTGFIPAPVSSSTVLTWNGSAFVWTAGGGGGGGGTVTSVDVSGGTTGLTFSGGPVITSGTITMDGTLDVDNGGTGATTAADARTNLSAAKSGANSDITSLTGLTGAVSSPTQINMGNGSAVSVAAGRMWYNETNGSWNLGMGGGSVTQQVGEEFYVYGKASSAITDSPLQIVYKTGTVGASGVISFAPTVSGITDGTKIIGIATENISTNSFGRITSSGVVHGITTNGTAYGETWSDNDTIWYDPVTGNPTNVKPVAPNVKVAVGIVIKAGSGGSGSFYVEINHGSVLGGTDSNVQITSVADTQLLQYYGAGGYWRNVNTSSVSIGTATNIAGGAAGSVPYNTAAGATSFLSLGTQNYVLTAGASAPQYVAQSTLSVGSATNLNGGSTGAIAYNTGAGATSFLSLGTTNYVLTAGASAPQYVAQSTITAGKATNVAGGTAGALPYNTAADTTSFLSLGTTNYVLTAGATAPQYVAQSTLSVGTATNLAGGIASQIPYQTGAGATSFIANGTAGQVLVSAGTSAPAWGGINGGTF